MVRRPKHSKETKLLAIKQYQEGIKSFIYNSLIYYNQISIDEIIINLPKGLSVRLFLNNQ